MNKEAQDFWARAVQALQTASEFRSRDRDAAASRAYYTAFYAVSAFFALEGRTFKRHTAVETAVHRDLVKPGLWPEALGRGYSFLHELRGTGDYGGGEHVSEEEAEKAVAIAQGILQAVHQLKPEVFPKPNSDLSSAT